MTDGAFSCCIDAVRPLPERPSDIVVRSERTESSARWRRWGFLFACPLRINPQFGTFLHKSAVGLPGIAIPCKRRHGQPAGARAGALERNALPGGAGPAQFTLKGSGKSNG